VRMYVFPRSRSAQWRDSGRMGEGEPRQGGPGGSGHGQDPPDGSRFPLAWGSSWDFWSHFCDYSRGRRAFPRRCEAGRFRNVKGSGASGYRDYPRIAWIGKRAFRVLNSPRGGP
jgi:hypothetical protein